MKSKSSIPYANATSGDADTADKAREQVKPKGDTTVKILKVKVLKS